MPKKFFKRYIPDHHSIREHQHLRFLGKLLHDPNLLHLNRRSVSGAFAVGLFMAFLPIPFQMLPAALGAIFFRVNLPISVALVWLTNPLTMAPVFYSAYKLGTWILGERERSFTFEPTVQWLREELTVVWEPFLLGSLIIAVTAAVAGYGLMRLVWRLHIVRNWEARKKRRQQ